VRQTSGHRLNLPSQLRTIQERLKFRKPVLRCDYFTERLAGQYGGDEAPGRPAASTGRRSAAGPVVEDIRFQPHGEEQVLAARPR
jgi:hypothetical protein